MNFMMIYVADPQIFSIVKASQFQVRQRRAANAGVTLCISNFPGETKKDREKLIPPRERAQNFLQNCFVQRNISNYVATINNSLEENQKRHNSERRFGKNCYAGA